MTDPTQTRVPTHRRQKSQPMANGTTGGAEMPFTAPNQAHGRDSQKHDPRVGIRRQG